jgi:hypothetical protein
MHSETKTEVDADAAVKQEKTDEPATNDKKRAREDDESNDQPEAKKQVVEPEAS